MGYGISISLFTWFSESVYLLLEWLSWCNSKMSRWIEFMHLSLPFTPWNMPFCHVYWVTACWIRSFPAISFGLDTLICYLAFSYWMLNSFTWCYVFLFRYLNFISCFVNLGHLYDVGKQAIAAYLCWLLHSCSCIMCTLGKSSENICLMYIVWVWPQIFVAASTVVILRSVSLGVTYRISRP